MAVALAVRAQSPHIRRARCSKRATREHRRKNERDRADLKHVPGHVPVLKRAVIDGGMNHVMLERATHEGSHRRNTETVFRVRGYRLRTKRIRGVYSQGFLLPIADVFTTEEMNALDFADGMDVTNYLEVVKYAPAPKAQPDTNGGNGARGKWDDSLAPKTDAERLQNLTRYWGEIQSLTWMPTLKVDGTSMTVANDAGEMRVFSRNLEVGEDNERAVAAKRNGLWAWLEANPGYTVQGELVGEGIQKNRLGINGRRVLVFSVWLNGVKLQRSQWPAFLENMGVPVLGDEWQPSRFESPEALIEAVNTLKGHIGSGLNEGIVYHMVRDEGDNTPLPRWMSSRENFKVVSNRYLAKFE